MAKQKDVKLEFVVIGSGDTSVGIRPSEERVTIVFHDQDDRSFDADTLAGHVEGLRAYLRDSMENCFTTVLTAEEYDAARKREAESEGDHV